MKYIQPGKCHGFTLMELMIAVAVVGILSAIAIPSYIGYTQRANRVDATAGLLRIQVAQEKFYLQNNTYADDASTDLGITGTESGYYTLAIAAADATGFTATAVPSTGSPQLEDDDCQAFGINARGVKTATDSGGADNSVECWE